MKQFIEGLFSLLAVMFNKVPFLKKLEGYRSVIGFVGLAIVSILSHKGVLVDPTVIALLNGGFMGWTALSLNAKGRE